MDKRDAITVELECRDAGADLVRQQVHGPHEHVPGSGHLLDLLRGLLDDRHRL